MVAHAIRPLQIAAAAAVENEVTAEVVVNEVVKQALTMGRCGTRGTRVGTP